MATNYQAKYFANSLTLEGGNGIKRLTGAFLNAAVDLNPHQVEAALFALHSPLSKGVLLADEVGLGKTIEAGLVLCQFWAERKRRLLILCPSSLRKQWQCELQEKFYLPCEIVDAKSARQLARDGFPNPFEVPSVVISSYPYAARNNTLLMSVPWDLVVMDEAHKLRNCYRESNRVGHALRAALADSRKLLLTATPLQNSLTELYGISTLIDEENFGDLATFRERFVNNGGDLDALRKRLAGFCWRTLRKDVTAFVKYTNRLPLTEKFECSDLEFALYEDVSRYLQDETTYGFPSGQRAMLTLLVRKVLASSSVALVGTLEAILARLKSLQEPNHNDTDGLMDSITEGDPDLVDEIFEDEDEEEHDNQEEGAFIYDVPKAETQPLIDQEKLENEIALVSDFVRRATAIGTDTKAKRLLLALNKGWKKMRELGAAEKAVIFTESRRSMNFLRDFLEANGYKGEVVCFSGGGKIDQTSSEIYEAYKASHKDDHSSRSVMMRHALIDAFKNKAKILIATEAGAEGINLQFCSMLVNYDLPWNPQRVEQRIGRCHRYGQKRDVVVVNFCNVRNEADTRVFELLFEKFKLFDGLFGASNDILGAIDETGKSFEIKINEILQKCRTEAEISESFDRLRDELQDLIAERMKQTREDVLTNLDDDVRKILHVGYDEAKDCLSDSEYQFMALTRHVLADRASFNEDDPTSFSLNIPPIDEIKPGKYLLKRPDAPDGPYVYRPNCALGEWTIDAAKSADTPYAQVTFDITNYRGKITALEALKGKSGYLTLKKLTVNSLDADGFLLFTGFTSEGDMVSPEDLERMFVLNQTESDAGELPSDISEKLDANSKLLASSTVQRNEERNNQLFKEKLTHLEQWVDDQVSVAERVATNAKKELRAARRARDLATNQEELAEAERKIMDCDRRYRKARREIDEIEDRGNEERDKIVSELKRKMKQNVRNETLFTIRWSVI